MKGAPRSYVKWKTFIGEREQDTKVKLAKCGVVVARPQSFRGKKGSFRKIMSLVLTR